MITNTLKQDLNASLFQVQRRWIRIPATLLLTPLVLAVNLAAAVSDTIVNWVWAGIKGE